MLNPRLLSLIGVIAIAAVMRWVPHPPNFTPIAAMALFGGAHFGSKKLAFMIPLLAMLISDAFIGFHMTQFFVYGSFAAVVGLGLLIRSRRTLLAIGGATLGGSLLFFFVTNFGSWLLFDMYPKTLAGLAACYTAGLPYFRNELLGNAFFVTILFGGFALAQKTIPALRSDRVVVSVAPSS
jgi:hypothetical protein